MNMMQNQFALSDYEANRRFNRYKCRDPFPDIPAALLNSADIMDYVAKTGMIWPFHTEQKLLKPASYEVKLLGKCVYWDAEGNKIIKMIDQGIEFVLEPNSIAFVTLEPNFRLPDYIALRFNLKIKHVYRGLLLGTGPLVDPGFKGKLSIPLHNLTTNRYVFKGGEGLIWMEFTKLSPNKKWDSPKECSLARKGTYISFEEEKSNSMEVEDYLYKADSQRPIRSSIPDALENAKSSANNAKESANKALDWVRLFGSVGLIGFVAVVFQVISLIQDLNSNINNLRTEVNEAKEESQIDVNNLRNDINTLNKGLRDLEAGNN